MSTGRRTSELLKLALTATCLTCVLAWWAGCGTPEQRYKLLAFFIDGVPDPNAPLGTDSSGQPVFYMEHKPYAEERCVECHGQVGQFDLSLSSYHRVNTDICMKCHEEQVSLHQYMHGPVASKACLWCHDPHESRHEHLLQDQPRRLCAQCHEPELLEPAVPEHADPAYGCLACHSGHGGTNPFFLITPTIPPLDESEAIGDDGQQADNAESGPEEAGSPADSPTAEGESPEQSRLFTSDSSASCTAAPPSHVESYLTLGRPLHLERGAR